MDEKLLIVDSYALCFRSFFGMINEPLINSNGDNVSTIAGFFSSLSTLLSQTSATHILIAADSKTKTFRHDMFPQYKANRPKTPVDLHRQIDCVMDILDKFCIKHISHDKIEADDIIASSINKFKSQISIILASGDKDLLQLVDDKNLVCQIRPNSFSKSWDVYNEEKVVKKYALPPSKIHLYLSLLGDSSDNIPGVEGIGEKSAISIANICSSISEIYEKINEFSPAIRKKLNAGKDDLELSYKLVELKTDENIEFELNDLKTDLINIKNGISALENIGINAVSKRLEKILQSCQKISFDSLSLF